jgi:hypothetical protein
VGGVDVGVTQAAGFDLDPDLVGRQRRERDLLDGERRVEVTDNGRRVGAGAVL